MLKHAIGVLVELQNLFGHQSATIDKNAAYETVKGIMGCLSHPKVGRIVVIVQSAALRYRCASQHTININSQINSVVDTR